MYPWLFRKILYPSYESVLRRRKTLRYFREYTQSQYLSVEELQHIQWDKLKALITFCYQHVPYYHKRWRELDIHPEDITSLTRYADLPVLTKDIIRQNYHELIAGPYKNKLITKATGGSTGEPVHFAISQESYERRTAVKMRGYAWAGAELGDKTALLWADPFIGVQGKNLWKLKSMLYNRVMNYKIFNSLAMDESQLDTYVQQYNRYQPSAFISYVNPLYEFAKYIDRKHIQVFSPKCIITGAEPLYSYQRELIEKVFSCKVNNTYGCREVMLIAAECSQQHSLHMNTDHLVIETVNDEFSTTELKGNLTITDLHNYGMPILRYVNGDVVTLSKHHCNCQCNLPVMEKVEGRSIDCIRTPDGKIIAGEVFPHLFKDIAGLRQFQVKQNSIERIEISLIKDQNFSMADFKKVNATLQQLVGSDIQIDYNTVETIPLTHSGKRRVVISSISKV